MSARGFVSMLRVVNIVVIKKKREYLSRVLHIRRVEVSAVVRSVAAHRAEVRSEVVARVEVVPQVVGDKKIIIRQL